MIRRRAELAAGPELVVPTFSSRTVVYKGMLTAPQLPDYFPDLRDDAPGERACPRALALLDEHVPELGARAPVPPDRAQRRDQHAPGQRQLDARPRVAAGVRVVRRRPPEGAARRPPGRIGLRRLRQRARAAPARGSLAPARGDDDDPGGVPGPWRSARRGEGLLRVPRLPDGGLGRARRDRVHGRSPDRRDARPQRPAAGPLVRDEGRVGRDGVGDRRPRRASGERRPEGPAPARQAVPGRRRPRPDRRGRGDQERGRRAAAVRPLVRGAGRAPRRSARARAAAARPPRRCASASSRSATRRRT